jgi:hypothetical protein
MKSQMRKNKNKEKKEYTHTQQNEIRMKDGVYPWYFISASCAMTMACHRKPVTPCPSYEEGMVLPPRIFLIVSASCAMTMAIANGLP